ncbi:26S proteasome regulatory subunit rpn1, partial [Striga asiatica]
MAPAEPNSGGSASGGATRDQAPVKVPSKDPKKKDDKKDEDLSEEDLALKQQLELYVERVQDPDPGLQKKLLADILSFLALTMSPEGEMASLMSLLLAAYAIFPEPQPISH